MAAYDAILFDKDGVLLDFQATYGAWTQALLGEFAAGDATLLKVLATELAFDLETARFRPESLVIAGTLEEVAGVLAPHLSMSKAAIACRLDETAMVVELAPPLPLKPLFSTLSAMGLCLGVVTNDSEASARAHLERVGITDEIAFLAGYDSGHGAKPGPGGVLAGAAALGATPARTLMVGDSLHDLMAGRAAGTGTLGVLTGVATRADLSPLADAVLPDIGHLPNWLETA